MFKKLFKPKWQSAKPQVRIQALQHLDVNDSNDLHIIELMAKGDADNEVRLAAIKRVPQREKMITLIAQEKDNGVRHRAIEFLLTTVAQTAAGIDPVFRNMIGSLDSQALVSIIDQTKNAELGALALEYLKDENVLEHYALHLPVAQMRQAAAQKLESEDVLERVIKASKGKDKGVWRICKDKLNAMRTEQQHEASIEQQIQDICQQIETLSRLPYDNLYAARVEHLQKRWQRLQHHADNEQGQRFNRAFSLCKATVDDIHNEQSRLQQETARQREALHERMAACEQLEEAVKQLSFNAVLSPADIPALQALLNTQKTRWDEAAAVVEPAADERKRFVRIHGLLQRALDAVRQLGEREAHIQQVAADVLKVEEATMSALQDLKKALNQALGDLQWPEELAWPESLKLHQQALAHVERLQTKAHTLEQDAINNIKGILAELAGEIEHGHLKSSQRLLKEASQLVKHLPMKTASGYQKRLRELTIRVNELRDWQGFVSTPKKEELCQEMESLVGAEMDPQALSNRIRRLQEEWRALGDADKGRNKELWVRFSVAAEKAYEPCRAYFDKLHEIRNQNLAQRQRLCDQLETYLNQYDWANADWKAVNEVYETAKNEWRLYTPVERKEGKVVQDRFNELLDRLRSKLQDEFNRNRAKREKLIEQAEALAQSDDVASAIDQVKGLQRQWREVGMVARKDDARLWKRFRAACDQIFARRDQQRDAALKEREQNAVHAEHLCEQIEQLAENPIDDVAVARQEFSRLRHCFEALGPLPRELSDTIQKRYQAVCQHMKQALIQAQAQLRQVAYQELWRRAAICDELEDSLLSAAHGEAINSSVAADWNSEQDLPPAAQHGLQARYDAVVKLLQEGVKPDAQTLADNAERLHDLCIRMEIVAGVDSPQQDQQRRMELQVSRLSSGLQGRQNQAVSGAELVEQLQVEWCLIGPVGAMERAQFGQRFKAALKKAML